MSQYNDLKNLFTKYELPFIEADLGVDKSIQLVQGMDKVRGHYGLLAHFVFKDEQFDRVELIDEENTF